MIEEPNELADQEHDLMKKLNEAAFTACGYKAMIFVLAHDLEGVLNIIDPNQVYFGAHRATIRRARELIK